MRERVVQTPQLDTYIEISVCNKNDLIHISTSNLNMLNSKYEKKKEYFKENEDSEQENTLNFLVLIYSARSINGKIYQRPT